MAPGSDRQGRPERAIELVRKKPTKGVLDAGTSLQNRQHVRAPYVTPVLLVSAGGVEAEGRCEEISEGGMLVVSPLALDEGAVLEVRFATPVAGDMVRVHAQVRWTSPGRGRCAMGLEFKGVEASVRGVISQYTQLFQEAHTA